MVGFTEIIASYLTFTKHKCSPFTGIPWESPFRNSLFLLKQAASSVSYTHLTLPTICSV